MSTVKEEAIKLRQNIDNVYEAGKKAEYDRFWDTYQDFGNRTAYQYAFAGNSWVNLIHELKYPIKFPTEASETTRNCSGMFKYFNRGNKDTLYDFSEICKKIDFSNCRTATELFSNARVDNVTVDFSGATRLTDTFNGADGGSGIKSITITVTEKCTYYYDMFNYQSALTNLIFTEGSVIAAAIGFPQSKLLSSESVQSIIDALQDRTGQTALKVTFHADVIANLTEEQTAAILAKNWQIG